MYKMFKLFKFSKKNFINYGLPIIAFTFIIGFIVMRRLNDYIDKKIIKESMHSPYSLN
jgi:membrane protein insertase Oxa1/YidC/SpoIIIJ